MESAIWILSAAVSVGMIFIIARLVVSSRRVSAMREKFLSSPLPDAWRKSIARDVPISEKIPPNLWPRYERLIKEFLADKNFEACGGLERVSDKIALVVAANASLLALGRDHPAWHSLKSVLIYPSAFGSRAHGNFCDGESWANGSVIFSQERILRDIVFSGNPQNVVLHEFAHQFADSEGLRLSPTLEKEWNKVLHDEMQRLREGDKRTILDEYGSDNPAEFFAVSTEAFFGTPGNLEKSHPELYATLSRIYALDPAQF